MKCPACKEAGLFTVYSAVCEACVGTDGSVEASHIEWCEEDTCSCDRCGHTGVAGDFREVQP